MKFIIVVVSMLAASSTQAFAGSYVKDLPRARIAYSAKVMGKTVFGTDVERDVAQISGDTLDTIFRRNFGSYMITSNFDACISRSVKSGHTRAKAEKICLPSKSDPNGVIDGKLGYKVIAPIDFAKYKNYNDILKFYKKCDVVYSVSYDKKKNVATFSEAIDRHHLECVEVQNSIEDFNGLQKREGAFQPITVNTLILDLMPYLKNENRLPFPEGEFMVLISYINQPPEVLQLVKKLLPETTHYVCKNSFDQCLTIEEYEMKSHQE